MLDVCQNAFYVLKKGERISSVLSEIEANGVAENKINESSRIAALFNFNNDGLATKRIVEMIERVIKKKKHGQLFYRLTQEEEYLVSIREYPELPYSYQHLIKYYIETGDYKNIERWVKIYHEKFEDPSGFIYELSIYYFEKKMFRQLKTHLERFLEKRELNGYGLFRLAYANIKLGYFKEANEQLEKIVRLNIDKELIKRAIKAKLEVEEIILQPTY